MLLPLGRAGVSPVLVRPPVGNIPRNNIVPFRQPVPKPAVPPVNGSPPAPQPLAPQPAAPPGANRIPGINDNGNLILFPPAVPGLNNLLPLTDDPRLDPMSPDFGDIPLNDPKNPAGLRPEPGIPSPVPVPTDEPGPQEMPGYGVSASVQTLNNHFPVVFGNLISFNVIGPSRFYADALEVGFRFSPNGDPCLDPVDTAYDVAPGSFKVIDRVPHSRGSLACPTNTPDFVDLPQIPLSDVPPQLFKPPFPLADPLSDPFFPAPLPGPVPAPLPLGVPGSPPLPLTVPAVPGQPEIPPVRIVPGLPFSDPNLQLDRPRNVEPDGVDDPDVVSVNNVPRGNLDPPALPQNLPQPKEPKKLPPPPFDLCEEPELPESEADPIVVVKTRTAVPVQDEILDFTDSTYGQRSVELPRNCARAVVLLYDFVDPVDEFSAYVGDQVTGKFGTAVLMIGSTAVQSYSLNRFQECVFEVPLSSEIRYSVLVIPKGRCRVAVRDLGDRWVYAKIANTDLLPTIDSSVLL